MIGRAVYLDSSAYVKFALQESSYQPLGVELSRWEGYLSSSLLATEVIRACGRYSRAHAKQARGWLLDVQLIPIDEAVLDDAASLCPTELGSLDAVHLATAVRAREKIGAFVTYDKQLLKAALRCGLPAVSPTSRT